MSPQSPETAALLAHVVSQVQANIQFLASQNYISYSDASAFLSKLPNNNNNQHTAPPAPATPLAGAVAAPPPAPRPVPAAPKAVQARALWAYNETGAEPNDLSFSAGEIIEIVEETNADWWTGKVRGKQALFPSSYVEKLPNNNSPTPAPAAKPVYRPFGAAYHGVDKPPPAGAGAVNSVGLQEAPGTEEKKSKYGKFGNTMAHSAAGGVGFGAGAAIGGGLVRAIF